MRSNPLRTLLLALAVAIAAILWFRWMASAPAEPPAAPAASDTSGGHAPAPAREAAPEPAAPEASADSSSEPGDLSSAWQSVDLEEIRRAMPDNLYWQAAMPTQDARVLREREDERARWNVEYGKVLSGNASEAEIQAYYAHRQRLSADYVEFTSYVLDQHGHDLSDQDVELLELARRLHLARLEAYPREIQQALERKQKQDQARADWRRDQAEFGEKAPK